MNPLVSQEERQIHSILNAVDLWMTKYTINVYLVLIFALICKNKKQQSRKIDWAFSPTLHTFCRTVLNDSFDELQPTLEVKILIVAFISLSNFMAGDGLESNTERLIRDSVSVVSGARNQNKKNNDKWTNEKHCTVGLKVSDNTDLFQIIFSRFIQHSARRVKPQTAWQDTLAWGRLRQTAAVLNLKHCENEIFTKEGGFSFFSTLSLHCVIWLWHLSQHEWHNVQPLSKKKKSWQC